MAKLRIFVLILALQALSLISAESSESSEQTPGNQHCSQAPKLTGPFLRLVGKMVDQVSLKNQIWASKYWRPKI